MVSSCAQCSTQQARSQEPKFKLQTSKRPANSGVGAAGRGARSVSRGGGADARACTGSRPRPRFGPLRPVPRLVRPAKRRPGAEIWRRPRGAPAVITRHLERKGEAGGDRSPGGGVALDGGGADGEPRTGAARVRRLATKQVTRRTGNRWRSELWRGSGARRQRRKAAGLTGQ